MSTNIPGILAGLESQRVEGTTFEPYCDEVKAIVHRITTQRGTARSCEDMAGDEYRFENEQFKLRFIESDYGNDHYYVEVNRNCWNDIPQGLNPFMVNENGPWNFCFHLQDSYDKKVLLFHLPGYWLDELKKLE